MITHHSLKIKGFLFTITHDTFGTEIIEASCYLSAIIKFYQLKNASPLPELVKFVRELPAKNQVCFLDAPFNDVPEFEPFIEEIRKMLLLI